MENEDAVAAAAKLYSVKDITTLISSPQVQVRQFTLAPGEEVPWHLHTKVVDTAVCLRGPVRVEMRKPGLDVIEVMLEAAENQPVPLNTPHRVQNPTDHDVMFLLVQGVGEYDFHKIE